MSNENMNMNVNAPTTIEDDTETTIRNKIVHILTIYPQISVSMLQIGVGTSLMPKLWKPVLDHMVEDGTVIRESKTYKTPTDRQQQYTIIRLADSNLNVGTTLVEMPRIG